MCGCEDLLGTDQTAATERSGAEAEVKEAHLPGVLIGLRAHPSLYLGHSVGLAAPARRADRDDRSRRRPEDTAGGERGQEQPDTGAREAHHQTGAVSQYSQHDIH